MSRPAKIYVAATVLAGLVSIGAGLTPWRSDDLTRFICYFLIATLASGFKLYLPGITGTMSVNFCFNLICVTSLSLPETLIIACTGTLLQCVWRARTRPQPVKLLFNVASVAIAVSSTSYWYNFGIHMSVKQPLMLGLMACIYFVANTAPVAIIVSLTEKEPLIKVWQKCYFWSFPYYLAGAALAGMLAIMDRMIGWETSLLIFPILYWIYRSYRLYLSRLEAEKKHVAEMAGLHLRTIEALALAIEAKDFNTYDHLRRVGVYAAEIAKEIGVSEVEMQALRAASLLHDIGKLAVPEHIISKPGRLTPVEFEKMKIHPVVGSEILKRVEFPYPVVPIVRSHHEKWDGSGYPDGIEGEDIPIGARILSVVDCFDAMASDRQYRRAVSPEDAMAYILSESGKSFDPQVVKIFARKRAELDQLVKAAPVRALAISRDVKIPRGVAPAAGFDSGQPLGKSNSPDFLSSIAAARQEAQDLFELAHELGNSLSLHETLSVLALRLKRLCPYDCIAIYVLRDGVLVPEFVTGNNFQIFSSLRIPAGEGLSGWVAQTKRPILNGNPSVEPGYLDDPERFSSLQSALAVPLEGSSSVVGVLSLYAAAPGAFTSDHLRILSAVTVKIALSIENALKYRHAEDCATTDALTGLPNARSLFIYLDSELARAKREEHPLSVLVCDLDGFKQVNDQFGHLEGNRVLRRTAEVLRENCREYDYVARMGGDEFVLVLPGSSPESVQARIKLLTEAVRMAGREIIGKDLLGMSVGQAFYPDHGTDAEQLLAEADRRMYKVKEATKAMAAVAPVWDLARLDGSISRQSPSPVGHPASADNRHTAAILTSRN